VSFLSKIEIRTAEEIDREEEERRDRLMRALQAQHAEAQSVFTAAEAAPSPPLPGSEVTYAQVPGVALPGGPMGSGHQPLPHPLPEPQGTFVRGERKVGRNELCPCGSGKKFKHCHGTLTSVE